jgi:hypothetical protein
MKLSHSETERLNKILEEAHYHSRDVVFALLENHEKLEQENKTLNKRILTLLQDRYERKT